MPCLLAWALQQGTCVECCLPRQAWSAAASCTHCHPHSPSMLSCCPPRCLCCSDVCADHGQRPARGGVVRPHLRAGVAAQGRECSGQLCAPGRDATLQVVQCSRPPRGWSASVQSAAAALRPCPAVQWLLRVQWDQHRLQPLDSEEGLEEKHAEGVLTQRWVPGW